MCLPRFFSLLLSSLPVAQTRRSLEVNERATNTNRKDEEKEDDDDDDGEKEKRESQPRNGNSAHIDVDQAATTLFLNLDIGLLFNTILISTDSAKSQRWRNVRLAILLRCSTV